MVKVKFYAILSILVLASMILASCAPQATPAPAAPAAAEPAAAEPVKDCSTYKAGSVEFQSNPFYDLVYKGLKERTDATGGELLRTVSGGDLKKELAAVEDFITQKIDVLFISATDPAGSMEAIRKANEAGIPVIFVALGPGSDQDVKYVTFIRSNDYKAASEVAEYILKQIDYKGGVVLADGPQVSVVLERMKAFKDVMAKYPDVFLAGQAMKEEVTIPANATMIENLLTAAPEAKVVFDYAGYGIPAAATVLPNLGRTDVYVGEIDGLPEEIELLASGAVKGATAQQQPYEFGKAAVEAWLKYCANPDTTDIPPLTEVPTLLITNENAKEYLQ